jgi:TRAP transporter TAXI family solute receptor
VASETQFKIGTGGVAGVYYQIGASVCRFMKKTRDAHGLRCRTVSTDGSVHNLRALREGTFDLAVVQSDLQHHAYHGRSVFGSAGPNEGTIAVDGWWAARQCVAKTRSECTSGKSASALGYWLHLTLLSA